MSWAFEIYYKRPADAAREESIANRVAQFGGRLQHREETSDPGVADNVCLTFEFGDQVHADQAASDLLQKGEHIEGPFDYG